MYKCTSLDEFRNQGANAEWQEMSAIAWDEDIAAIEYVVDHHTSVVKPSDRTPGWVLMVLVHDTDKKTTKLVQVTAPPVPVYNAETVEPGADLHYYQIDLTEVSP